MSNDEETLFLDVDHSRFLINGKEWIPQIHDNWNGENSTFSNSVCIRLSATPQDSLEWDKEIDLAAKAIAANKRILWELDFGFGEGNIYPSDGSIYEACRIAIDEFLDKIWKKLEKNSIGVVLYRGKADFEERVALDETLETTCTHIIEDITGEKLQNIEIAKEKHPFLFKLSLTQLISDYLHRFIALLPVEMPAFAYFDVSEITSKTEVVRLFQKERFEHINLIIAGSPVRLPGISASSSSEVGFIFEKDEKREIVKPRVGVVFPENQACSNTIYAQLESIITDLENQNIPYRAVSEAHLTSEWDEIDHMIVLPKSLGKLSTRKLLGFIAAGGEIVSDTEMEPPIETTNYTKWLTRSS